MEKILLLLHTEPDGPLGKPALEAVETARKTSASLGGASFAVGLIGAETQTAANGIARCGAVKFFAVNGPEFAQSRYSTDALAAEALCKAAGASLIIAPATSRWARVLPGVAQRLGGRVDTHVSRLAAENGKIAANRWYYRQRMEGVFSRAQRPWCVLVDPGSEAPWNGAAGQAQVEALNIAAGPGQLRTTVTGLREPPAGSQTIRPDAELLFVTGAGWTKKQADGQPHVKEAEQLISNFLNQSRASLGSTKSLVDLGGEGQAILSFLTHLNQVGQTGSTPRHQKGLATCCHGEEPHTVGWRFINERRAVNLDPNCGWARGKADVLYVADAFAVVAKLNELLAAK